MRLNFRLIRAIDVVVLFAFSLAILVMVNGCRRVHAYEVAKDPKGVRIQPYVTEIMVTARENEFIVPDVLLRVGERITLRFKNEDRTDHELVFTTFPAHTLKRPAVSTICEVCEVGGPPYRLALYDVKQWSVVDVVFEPLQAGMYTFQCMTHSIVGALILVDQEKSLAPRITNIDPNK